MVAAIVVGPLKDADRPRPCVKPCRRGTACWEGKGVKRAAGQTREKYLRHNTTRLETTGSHLVPRRAAPCGEHTVAAASGELKACAGPRRHS